MELLSEEKDEKQNRSKKYVAFAIIIAVILLVLVFVMIMVLQQAEKNKEKLMVNGKKVTLPPSLTIVDNATGITYFSIKQVADLTGYNYYNGGYQQYSEDKTKCYVESEKQVATLELDSNIVYKNTSEDKINFDNYKIDLPVKTYNNELYATQQAIQLAFNITISYKTENKTLYIYTLPYLVEYYNKQATNNQFTAVTEDFMTQKAIINNMLVVSKNEKYGVISTTDFSEIIGAKYDKLTYLESTDEFLATNSGKTGVLSKTGDINIKLEYDEIGLVDSQLKLYYVKKDNLYGVLGKRGNVLVNIEYNDIGIDKQSFPSDEIENGMFLYENCIPIKKGNKWGIANKAGQIILNLEYDEIGYITKYQTANPDEEEDKNNELVEETEIPEKSMNNAVIIPNVELDGKSIEGIVIGKNGKYGVANSIGNVLIPCEYDRIYSITNEGENVYYMEKNGKVTSVQDYVNANQVLLRGLISDYRNVIVIDENTVPENTTNTTNKR